MANIPSWARITKSEWEAMSPEQQAAILAQAERETRDYVIQTYQDEEKANEPPSQGEDIASAVLPALAVPAGYYLSGLGGSGAAAAGATAATAATGAAIPAAPTILGAGAVGGSGAAAGGAGAAAGGLGSGAMGMLGPAAGIGAGALMAYGSVRGIDKIMKGEEMNFGEQAALALPTFGASLLYNKFRRKPKTEVEDKRVRELTEKGVRGFDKIFKKTDDPNAWYRNDLAADHIGMAQDGEWNNNKFAQSRDVNDLRAEDVWGYGAWGEKFGNQWLEGASEEQRRQIANEALKRQLIKEHHGTIDIGADASFDQYAQDVMGGKAPAQQAQAPAPQLRANANPPLPPGGQFYGPAPTTNNVGKMGFNRNALLPAQQQQTAPAPAQRAPMRTSAPAQAPAPQVAPSNPLQAALAQAAPAKEEEKKKVESRLAGILQAQLRGAAATPWKSAFFKGFK